MSSAAKKHLSPQLRALVIATAYCLAAICLSSYLARWSWRLELLCHLRLQFSFLLLVAALLLFGLRSYRHALAILAICMLQFATIAPLYFGNSPPQASKPDLRVMALNVLTVNQDSAECLEIIRRNRPQVLVLTEVNARWIEQLRELEADYPFRRHQLETPFNFGISIYSQRPLRTCRFVKLADTNIDAVLATIEAADQELQIIGAHPVPPMSAGNSRARNRQLQHLAQLARESNRPTILLGDLNVTDWSPYFQDLLRDGNCAIRVGVLDCRLRMRSRRCSACRSTTS